MGVGPETTTTDTALEPATDLETATATSSLFDRIAAELRDEHARSTGADDVTSEIEIRDFSGPGGIVIEPSGAWPAPDISTQMHRPVLADRQCSRTGCSDTAAVTLSYDYATQQVWIDALHPEREPHRYDLCGRHADRLSVPQGWHLDDRRRGDHTSLIAV